MTTAAPATRSHPQTAPTPGRISHRAAFWTLAAILFAFMCAAAAPSPLYVVYQSRWHFSATTLTVVFALYALALLIALMVVGALSDHVGRRPVLIAALAAEAVAMALFVVADGVPWLLAARAVQGLATGAATGAISAGVMDLQSGRRPGLATLVNSAGPGIGLGAGALGSGLLVEYAPAPRALVFVILGVLFLIGIVAVAVTPETARPHPGALASLRPRVGVPAGARGRFLAVVPTLVATWAVAGLYLSLGPSLAAGILGVRSHLIGGLVVFALMIATATASIVLGGRGSPVLMTGGSLTLAFGLGITLVALHTGSVALFFVGTVIAGLGFGSAFLGAFGILAGLAEPSRRAELFATVYTVNYLAFSLPAVAAGMAVSPLGLSRTADIYASAVIAIALASALGSIMTRKARETS
ncbi:MFS transporter [Embleya scabrispora]|uniref:MFS transporter n=1 Tax=Embleya scabrispora TaxID=159449 RepID=UPI000C7E063C|nr:MFS transporter [Embleya scabrispora]